MTQSRKRLKTSHDGSDASLTALGDDMLIGICSHLQSNDLASVSCTCKYFGEKRAVVRQDDDVDEGISGNENNGEQSLLTLMESVAKQMVERLASNEEKEALLRYINNENGIVLYDRLLMLRSPLLFEQLIGQGLEYIHGDKNKIALPVITGGSAMHTAISNQVIKASTSGKYYATFTIRGGGDHVYVGIIRPIKDWDRKALKKFSPLAPKHKRKLLAEKTSAWGSSSVNCCAIRIGSGQKYSTSWSSSEGHQGAGVGWGGMHRFQSGGETTTFSLLLDADNGTLSVYQNGRNLGLMTTGLTGSYCWTVNFWGMANGSLECDMQLGNAPSE